MFTGIVITVCIVVIAVGTYVLFDEWKKTVKPSDFDYPEPTPSGAIPPDDYDYEVERRLARLERILTVAPSAEIPETEHIYDKFAQLERRIHDLEH